MKEIQQQQPKKEKFFGVIYSAPKKKEKIKGKTILCTHIKENMY